MRLLPPALLLALAAASCSPSPEPATSGRSLRDGTGASVRVPERAERIVSLAPDLTQTLFALGAGSHVVGVSESCDRPAERLAGVSRVGQMVEPSLEAILALEPDLVLASADGNPLATLLRLRELGVTVYGVKPTSEGLAGVSERIRVVGAAAGRATEAEAGVAELEARFAEVRAAAARRERLEACWLVWEDPPIAAGDGSFVDGLMDMVGLDNACARGDEAWPSLSREELLVAAPEALIVSSEGHGESGLRLGGWAEGLPALRSGRVLRLPPDDFSRPTLELGRAAERLLEETAAWSAAP